MEYTVSDVIEIYNYILTRDNEKPVSDLGFIHRQKIEAALQSAYMKVFYKYENLELSIEIAVALWRSIARNHPLPNANKRVSFILMLEVLSEINLSLDASEEEVKCFVLEQLLNDTVGDDIILAWVEERLIGA